MAVQDLLYRERIAHIGQAAIAQERALVLDVRAYTRRHFVVVRSPHDARRVALVWRQAVQLGICDAGKLLHRAKKNPLSRFTGEPRDDVEEHRA